jgi:starch synthase (maltosyl-transferring)
MITTGFEFGFRRKPHVIRTTPGDWENTGVDITAFIGKVNRIKTTYGIFQEEAPTQIYTDGNPEILAMWKGSSRTDEEGLLLLNKDIHNRQYFSSSNIHDFFESKARVVDVSPENPLGEIPGSFSYDFGPGEGKVLVTGD